LSKFNGSVSLLGTDTIVGNNGANISFFGNGTVAQQTVTGSVGGNAALASLLAALAAYGLIDDSSSP
jgi:hypothetical protein